MLKTLSWITAITILIFAYDVRCEDLKPSPQTEGTQIEIEDSVEVIEETPSSNVWQKIWGVKARDAVLLGMWSIHIEGTGEFFGDGRHNGSHQLIGLQYYGLTAGTFINSNDDRAWFFGSAREVFSHNFSDDTRFDIGYKVGLLYGYEDDVPNVGGVSLFATGTFGFSWKRLGFDIGVIPIGIITANFRFDIDF